jgi:hypothetical protein
MACQPIARRTFGNASECLYVVNAVIQTGDVGKILAAGLAEYFRVCLYDLLERFQAVRSKARADNINAGYACLC